MLGSVLLSRTHSREMGRIQVSRFGTRGQLLAIASRYGIPNSEMNLKTALSIR